MMSSTHFTGRAKGEEFIYVGICICKCTHILCVYVCGRTCARTHMRTYCGIGMVFLHIIPKDMLGYDIVTWCQSIKNMIM